MYEAEKPSLPISPAAGPTRPWLVWVRHTARGPRSPPQQAPERGAGPGGAASAQAHCVPHRAAASRAALLARDGQGREEPETEEEAEAAAAEAGRLR